jgi:uncharacterized protein with PhoU and TrkA domain
MKPEVQEAILSLITKAPTYGDAESVLKMAQAAQSLANAAYTLDELTLDTPAGVPEITEDTPVDNVENLTRIDDSAQAETPTDPAA